MNQTVDYEFQVEWGDCDPAGIVFYPSYFRWFDIGTHRMMSAAGVGQRVQTEKFGIVGAVLVSAKCDFRRPVTFGDRLLHRVRVTEWGDRSFVVSHVLAMASNVAAQGTETRVCLARETSGAVRSITIPDGFRQALTEISQ
jgi:4-hydroxybenzoyl-CoA thioesterase